MCCLINNGLPIDIPEFVLIRKLRLVFFFVCTFIVTFYRALAPSTQFQDFAEKNCFLNFEPEPNYVSVCIYANRIMLARAVVNALALTRLVTCSSSTREIPLINVFHIEFQCLSSMYLTCFRKGTMAYRIRWY